jgi:allantoin racemase
MSRLLVVNPNTSQTMTETIRVSAETAARSLGVDVDTVCATSGPESIESRFDEIVSAYWTLDTVMRAADHYDGIVVACFSQHVVIEGIREATEIPTLGILEASALCALPLGARFSVVTTSPRWEPLLADGLRSLGLHERCASVRSSGLTVLDLDRLPHQEVLQHLTEQAELAVARDGAEVIVLGCAGMAGLQNAVAQRANVPVIDAVAAGVSLMASLTKAGARTSKHNLYRPVLARNTADLPPGLARVYGSGARE